MLWHWLGRTENLLSRKVYLNKSISLSSLAKRRLEDDATTNKIYWEGGVGKNYTRRKKLLKSRDCAGTGTNNLVVNQLQTRNFGKMPTEKFRNSLLSKAMWASSCHPTPTPHRISKKDCSVRNLQLWPYKFHFIFFSVVSPFSIPSHACCIFHFIIAQS